ncbi:MAG: hypothetical protein NC122_06380, partial [Faecalibacterium sp.]|nr:hypothetical protein [Ruminococcus sp.]MCM1485818.1 hypothetical protein [Faecalibacterium sp.]
MATYPYTYLGSDGSSSGAAATSWTYTVNASTLGNAVKPNIVDGSTLTNVTISWDWKTSIAVNASLDVYIGGTKIGGTYKNKDSYDSLSINNLQGYFNSGTADVGQPTGNIEFRFSGTFRKFTIRNVVISFEYNLPQAKITFKGSGITTKTT